MSRESPWRSQLTAGERRMGWVFFALYLFVFPFLVGGVFRILDERWELVFTPAQSNAIYYSLVLLILLAAFWEFLKHAGAIFRDNWRENLFALGVGLAAALLLTALVGLIPLPVEDPARSDAVGQYAMAPGATVAVVVFLRPAVEELLYRGFLFGALRRWNRWVAYGASAGLFALASVWQLAFPWGGSVYLLLAVGYLPLGLALTWSYDVGGSIYTPIVLRTLFSGILLALSLKGG